MHSSIGILPVAFIPPCKGIKFFSLKKLIFYPNLSAILDFRVRNVFLYQIDIRNRFLVVEVAKKVYLFIFVAFICQKLFFYNVTGGHFGFTPLEKNAAIIARDTGAKYVLKGSRKSNQSSKHLSQKMVMKVRVFTLLLQAN